MKVWKVVLTQNVHGELVRCFALTVDRQNLVLAAQPQRNVSERYSRSLNLDVIRVRVRQVNGAEIELIAHCVRMAFSGELQLQRLVLPYIKAFQVAFWVKDRRI